MNQIATLHRLHEAMLVSRSLDERCLDAFAHWYPAVGEEGTTMGAFAALADEDFAVPHYRGSMGVFHLRGMPLREIIGGILVRENSVTGGRLSGLHGGDFERNILPYVTNVLGPNVGTGCGIAMADQLLGRSSVTMIGFGDGTAALGAVHESLNLASLYRLPVVFVCQNNQYSISTRSADYHSWSSIREWAEGYNVPAVQVDGNDVVAVHAAATEAVGRARSGDGPTVMDALTFRMGGHFSSDPASYQDPSELDSWAGRDPIRRLERRLIERSLADESEVEAVHARISAKIEQAWQEVELLPLVGT